MTPVPVTLPMLDPGPSTWKVRCGRGADGPGDAAEPGRARVMRLLDEHAERSVRQGAT